MMSEQKREPIAVVAASPSSRWLEALRSAIPGERIVPIEDLSAAERGTVRLAIVNGPAPDALATLPALEWVQSTWAGVEALLPAVPDNVPLVRLTDPQLADTMAEAVLTAALWLHRHGPTYVQQQRRGEWRAHDVPLASERRIAILGLGKLGQRSAERLIRNGFAVSGWRRSPKSMPDVKTHHGPDGLHAALGGADIIVSLLPLTDATRGLLGADAFAAVKRGAALVNFGRGPVVDDNALLEALDNGTLDHALLDVFASEPLPRDHPFWAHERVTVWPHVSAPTNRQTASRVIAKAVEHWRAEGAIPEAVDRSRGY